MNDQQQNNLDATDRLRVKAPAPAWFRNAVAAPKRSCRVEVDGCAIHYLLWRAEQTPPTEPGILFVHGGGAHAQWWSFIAPFFRATRHVAAMDLSGMGDSGRRPAYSAELRGKEIRAVLADAGLGPQPVLVGHSFGGYMSMAFARRHGDELAAAVIVDSPVRAPAAEAARKRRRMGGPKVTYPDFEAAVARFRLVPEQPCENAYIVEHIARHSITAAADGWVWKFDPAAMHGRRFDEPFAEHLARMRCRRALVRGEHSALLTPEVTANMAKLMGPEAPVITVPEAHHHVMLDQPLAFVAALRGLLATWRT